MTALRSRRLASLPRALRRRLAARRGREEELRTRLRSEPEAPALVLSPHWDDAALDLWGLLSGERKLSVVNLFAGVPEPGQAAVWASIIGVEDSAARARARMAEDARALALAGRTPVNLSLLEAGFRGGRPVTLQDIDRALAEHVGSASRVYAPAGIGGHVDHLHARRYARALLRSGLPVTLYAELPYCTFHGWPAWVDGDSKRREDVDAYWRSFLAPVPEMPPLRSARVERLDGPLAASKLAAIGCYEASLNYGVRRLMSDPAFHRYEVSWELERSGGPAAAPAEDGVRGPDRN